MGVVLAFLILLAGCAGESDGQSSSTSDVEAASGSATESTAEPEPEPEGLPTVVYGLRNQVSVEPIFEAVVQIDRATGVLTDVLTSQDVAGIKELPVDGEPEDLRSSEDSDVGIKHVDLSPDGTEVAVGLHWRDEGQYVSAVVVAPVDRSTPYRVLASPTMGFDPPTGTSPHYSPDGRYVMTFADHAVLVEVATGGYIQTDALTPYGAPGFSWSPDATEVAWGNHFERTMEPSMSIARWASADDLASLEIVDSVGGASAWFSADGTLHTVETGCCDDAGLRADDTDSSYSWVIGTRWDRSVREPSGAPVWWPADGGADQASPLSGMPDGIVAVVW